MKGVFYVFLLLLLCFIVAFTMAAIKEDRIKKILHETLKVFLWLAVIFAVGALLIRVCGASL